MSLLNARAQLRKDASRHGKIVQDSVKVTWHSRTSFSSLQLEGHMLFMSNAKLE